MTTPSIHKCNQEQKHNQTHHQCAQSPEYFEASLAVLFAQRQNIQNQNILQHYMLFFLLGDKIFRL
jgi:hypothetical protein